MGAKVNQGFKNLKKDSEASALKPPQGRVLS